MKFNYDIIVVGAGHAGCEAAHAAAKMGCTVLLITADLKKIALMACNPAIGGIAKGHIVREIDALGGMMGIIADSTAIQFRMLNRSKGPAVWSPRSQSDSVKYSQMWRSVLEANDNLYLYQDEVSSLLMSESGNKKKVIGVKTCLGVEFYSKSVILTVGTFLNGLMHFGEKKMPGGRISERADSNLTRQLVELGFKAGRMKTGTPPRIDGRSIDFSLAEIQEGEDRVFERTVCDGGKEEGKDYYIERDFHKFSFLPHIKRSLMPRFCYIVHTNKECHKILEDNLDKSPLYNGQIKSIGPRYCPSIETKIVTFSDKDSHQLYIEPEGESINEFYLNGFSSSLPFDVQLEALKCIPAFKNIQIYRPGYAIEYDYFDPLQLTHDLQTKLVDNLYFAGQINGTTGYEEAAAQGLMAGINACRKVKGGQGFVLGRDEAYIGVLIDDLVTKSVDEPYRMFTSRAEYRILLRQDDADMRLTPLGYEIGLVTKDRYDWMVLKKKLRDKLIDFCERRNVKISEEINVWLENKKTSPIKVSTKIADLIKRPQLSLIDLNEVIPELNDIVGQIPVEIRYEVVEAAEILIKYEGYLNRERELAEKASRLENLKLKDNINYHDIKSLSTEARQKLDKIRPETIGQASRIPGVSPADISVLLVLMGR